MAKTKFKIGDRVKISWIWNESDGKIGTLVKKGCCDVWTIKIPGFKGHDGNANYGILGNDDKWLVNEFRLTKLSTEKKSMKIEVKQTKKTEKKTKEIVYPCFRRSTNECKFVVLFFNKNFGVVVDRGGSGWRNGETMDHEPVKFETLQNYSATISSQP